MIDLTLHFFLVFVCIESPPTTGSLEEAEKNIIERFNAIHSLAATMTNEESQEKDGKRTTVIITRQVEWVRKDQGFFYRAETRTKMTQAGGGEKSSREFSSTTVSDGERVVRLTEQDGAVTAVQRKADVTETPDVRAMFEELRKDSKLKRFPDVKVGTDDCYAIQVIPKERKGSDISQTMIYFRKDIGLDVRTVVYGKDNKPIFTSTTTKVRPNLEIPADRFAITLPDGVQLIDQTRP